MIICAIYDKKAKTYDTPFVLPNVAIATRAFENQMRQENINKYCSDFELHQLGVFENNKIQFDKEKNEMIILNTWDLWKQQTKLADGASYAQDLPVQEIPQMPKKM